MINKKISVIIPVYNVEPIYIENAINSVFNQTYKNIEIIVVNDGSTDERTIEYLKSIDNPIIKIINQENKCAGGARNTGVENSTGEYIGFLDADDWLDSNFYEVLYNLCEESMSDIACGTLTRVEASRQKPMERFYNNTVTNFVKKMNYIKNGSVSSKLFNKKLFSNLSFEEHVYYEDNSALIKLLLKSGRVSFTNKVKYYYRENPVSTCLDLEKTEKRKKDRFYVLNTVCELVRNKSQIEKDAVLYAFIGILIDGDEYNSNFEYRNNVQNLLGKNYKKYLESTKNSLLENIFSIKNTPGKTYKVITILWIKIKIKRKPKNQ